MNHPGTGPHCVAALCCLVEHFVCPTMGVECAQLLVSDASGFALSQLKYIESIWELWDNHGM